MGRRRKLPLVDLERSGLRDAARVAGAEEDRSSAGAASRIVARAAAGGSAAAVAAELKVCPATVRKWWHRFHQAGVDGLLDEPRPGQPRKLPDAQIEQVIVRTLESKPQAATHLADAFDEPQPQA